MFNVSYLQMANIILHENKTVDKWIWKLVGDQNAAVVETGLGLTSGQAGIEELVNQSDQDFLWKCIWLKNSCIIVWRLDWDKYGLLTGHRRPYETHGESLLEERRPFGCFQTFLEEERPLGCFQHLHLRNHTYRTVPPCKRWLMFFVWFFLCAELLFQFLPPSRQLFAEGRD